MTENRRKETKSAEASDASVEADGRAESTTVLCRGRSSLTQWRPRRSRLRGRMMAAGFRHTFGLGSESNQFEIMGHRVHRTRPRMRKYTFWAHLCSYEIMITGSDGRGEIANPFENDRVKFFWRARLVRWNFSSSLNHVPTRKIICTSISSWPKMVVSRTPTKCYHFANPS